MTRYELGIEGADVVMPGGIFGRNVYVEDGRIAAVTSEQRDSSRTVDASGLLVMPGMVDSHVHLMDPGDPQREDFPHGSAAAARSGVTTVIEHTHGRPVRNARDYESKAEYLSTRSRVDFALAAHVWPGEIADAEAAWAAGAAYLKVFTCTTHGVPGHGTSQIRALFERGAAIGAVFLVHAEDDAMTARAEEELRAAGRTDGGIIPEWRNLEAELTAVGVVAALARETDATVVIAHASCPDTVSAAGRLVDSRVKVETCPQYLTLFRGEALTEGALRKFTPPARAASGTDLDRMWQLLADHAIDLVSSDHAPSTRGDKLAGDVWSAHFGLPGLDTTMGILLDGAASGRIQYQRIVELYSQNPARLYGMWPRKGSLEVGADADLVLVDPTLRWTVEDADVRSLAGWSPYSGRQLTGRAVETYVRGRLVMRDGEVIAPPGTGRLLRGAGPGRGRK